MAHAIPDPERKEPRLIRAAGPQPPVSRFASDNLLSILGLSLLAVLLIRATVTPIVTYDSWMYHLPWASRLWGIGGGAATFHMDPRVGQFYQGFPLLWEWVQGAAWTATGALSVITLPQTMLVLIFLYVCRRYLLVPAGWVALGLVACPMVLLHIQSTNNDLASAIAIAIGLFLTTDLLAGGLVSGNWWSAAGAVVAFAIAGNIKFQGLIACFVVAVIVGLEGVVLPRIGGVGRRAALIAILAVSLAAGSMTAIKNFVRFGNPVYPIKAVIAGHVIFDGPGPDSAEWGVEPPAYLLRGSKPISLPEPVNFILSITELDWTMRGVAPWYNYDSVTGRQPRRGPPSRTGGWGLTFVAMNLMLLSMQLFRIRQIDDRRQRLMVINTVLLTVLTAFLPRSHELRYYLYLPLVWIPVNLRYLRQQDPGLRFVAPFLVGLAGFGVALTVLSPKSEIFDQDVPSKAERLANVPAEIRAALAKKGIYCDPENGTLFMYSFAVTGLPGILSTNPDDCGP